MGGVSRLPGLALVSEQSLSVHNVNFKSKNLIQSFLIVLRKARLDTFSSVKAREWQGNRILLQNIKLLQKLNAKEVEKVMGTNVSDSGEDTVRGVNWEGGILLVIF